MSTTVTTRQARPEAILIVLFLVIALFVLLSEGTRGKKDPGSGGSGDGGDLESGVPEKEAERDRRDRRERGKKKEKKKEKSKKDGGESTTPPTTPTTSSTGLSDNTKKKKEKKKEQKKEQKKESKKKEDKKEKKKDEGKKGDKKKDDKKKEKKKKGDPIPTGEPDLPADLQGAGPALSDKKWIRNPNARPERPSGRSPPILLKRNPDGTWNRPPMRKDGVKFNDGGEEGKELGTYAKFNTEDVPTTIYDQTHMDVAKNYKSIKRGEASDILYGAVDGSQSPFHTLRNSPGLSSKLKSLMGHAERLSLTELLLNRRVGEHEMKQALQDSWLDNVGPIPTAVANVISQMVMEKVIDISLVTATLASPDPEQERPERRKSAKLGPDKYLNDFAGHLLEGGFTIEELRAGLQFSEWKKMSNEKVRERVAAWTAGQVQKGKAFALLACFFVPFYRATTSYKGKHLIKKEPIGWEAIVGSQNKLLVEWLRYIGKGFLISRMFSRAGADISDMSVRVCVSPRKHIAGLVLDFTIFTPEPDQKEEGDWGTLKGIFGRAEQSIARVTYLGLRWIDHLNENVYPQPVGRQLFPDSNPFHMSRLTFRPGLKLKTVNPAAVRLTKSGATTPRLPPEGPVRRDARIMNVSRDSILELHEQLKGKRGLPDSFARVYRTAGATTLRFVDQRQYHWFAPPGAPNTRFDETTFLVLLLCASRGLMGLHLPQRFDTKEDGERNDPGAAMDLLYDVGYGKAEAIDFGGLVPVDNPKAPRPRLLHLDLFDRLKHVLLPVMFHAENTAPNYPASASLILNPNWGLAEHLYGGPNAITVTFHGASPNEAELLRRELVAELIEQVKVSMREMASGRTEEQLRAAVLDELASKIRLIRRRVKYVALSEERPSADEADIKNDGFFQDFDVPEQYLPSSLRR
ncbi:hypothetical protein IAT38_000337 [Cryptococcus sp. DSM 104549]